MADISVVIPSVKTESDLKIQIEELKDNAIHKLQVVSVCKEQSAAKNRNECIECSIYDLIIMMDDDIKGFYRGWDNFLITPLLLFSDMYSIAAARLIDNGGNRSPQLGDCNHWDNSSDYVRAVHTKETKLNITGSSCIAFYKDDLRFDENYLGATYEDADFCMQMNKRYPDKEIIINNTCKLIHDNEGKGRRTGSNNYWAHNKKYFAEKWGIEI